MIDFIEKIDFAILDYLRLNFTSPFMDRVMVFFTTLGNAGALWIIISIAMLFTRKYRKTGIMMALGLILCLITGNIILKPSVARLRPFQVKTGIELLIKAPHDFSFPSGHTFSSFVSAAIIFLNHKKIGVWAIGVAFLIAFSRLYLYVHFPSDVFVGAALGILFAFLSKRIVNYFVKTEKN